MLSAAASPSKTLIEQHALAQQGLNVAAGQSAIYTQALAAILYIEFQKGTCVAEGTGASVKLVSRKKVSKHKTAVDAHLYFDEACKNLYADMALTYDIANKKKLTYAGTAKYSGPTGFSVGTLQIAGYVVANGSTQGTASVGEFQPAGGGAVADIGFACNQGGSAASSALSLLASMATNKPTPCELGIAQKFASLSRSLASIATLTLTREKNDTKFSGKKSEIASSSGKLSITEPKILTLGVGGAHKDIGSANTTGIITGSAFFPSTPTKWTVTDAANNAIFAIALNSNQTHDSTGTINNKSTGATLAQFSVDESGTGSITYSNKTTAKISGWILSN